MGAAIAYMRQDKRGAPIMYGSLAADEHDKLQALKRIKLLAGLSLAACLGVMIAARLAGLRWPAQHAWLAYVAAFAEAAAIGGLADWYAVVALFRRPLGLPIPHTAIIPANQGRIADNLGRFIETHFLSADPVRRKLGEIDFAGHVASWLGQPDRASHLSGFVSRLVPQTLAAVEDTGLKGFVAGRLAEQAAKVKAAPLAADLLSAFTDDGRHQKLLDEMLGLLEAFLSDGPALDTIRDKIREELPSVFNLFRADAYLLRRIIKSAGTMLQEVRNDPKHALRGEFDAFIARFIRKLRRSKRFQARADKLKQDFLARPELRAMSQDIWKSLRAFAERDIASDNSQIRRHLAALFGEIGRKLADEPKLRADMNAGFSEALGAIIESQKGGVSGFVAEQVKSWDLGQLTTLIELNVGRDLQFIRFNGMVIGGLAGLALHALGQVLSI